MTVTKSTVIENTWKEFYDRVKSQVTTVSITGGTIVTINNYVSNFPDQLIDTKSNYPILVVETPNFNNEIFTIGKGRLDGSISIEIYTNQAESADKFLSNIIDSIETNKYNFRLAGLTMVKLDSTNTDSASRDKIKVHMRTAIFTFSFQYTKTGAY